MRLFTLSAALCLAVLCVGVHAQDAADDTLRQFGDFIQQYGKVYLDDAEYSKRFEIFQANLEIIQRQNEPAADNPNAVRFGVNQFSDMTQEEVQQKLLLPRRPPVVHQAERYAKPVSKAFDLPATFDWRDQGAVTDVRDQGSVGTCWAFSTTENIESQWYLAGNNLTMLSVEQIVDCDYTADPCNEDADCGVFGGWPYLAYQYVIRTGGLTSESQYPYCVGTGDCFPCQAPGYNATRCGPPVEYCNKTFAQCPKNGEKLPYSYVAQITDWTAIQPNETEMAYQLVQRGPLSILIDASWLSYYKSGIWPPNDHTCSKTDTDHAVLLVGYGADYWIVRNSWGKSWGMEGYFYLKSGENACAVNTGVTTSIISKADLAQPELASVNRAESCATRLF